MQLLADRVALAIEQSRLYESERAASRRLEFLAEASELLGATLDYSVALQGLTALAVPASGSGASWTCSARLARAVAVGHADPEAQVAAYEFLERFPLAVDAAHGPGRVIARREAKLILR